MKNAVIISCFDWYEKRLEPIKKILDSEYEVTILTSDFGHISKKKIENKYDECEYISVPSYKKNISVKRIVSHFVFGVKSAFRLNRIAPDMIYLLLPPNNIAMYCVAYKRKHPECKFYVDIIDLWPESMPLEKVKNFFLVKKWREWREKSIASADKVIVECDYYKKYILSSSKISPLYLFKNESTIQKEYFSNNINTWIEYNIEKYNIGHLRVGYVGSINNIIDIEEIVRILLQLKKRYALELHIIGKGEREKAFIDTLNKNKINVRFYGAVFDEIEKMDILGKCHFGLNIMKESASVGLSIKSIDYFSMGLPIINNIKGDTWQFVVDNNLGINIRRGENLEMSLNLDWYHWRKNIRGFYNDFFSREAFLQQFKQIMKEKEED